MFLGKILMFAVLAVFIFILGSHAVLPENNMRTEIPPTEERSTTSVPEKESGMFEKIIENAGETAKNLIPREPVAVEIPVSEPPEPLPKESGNAGFPVALIDDQEETPINFSSIVAVQCVWDYTFPENVYEDPRFHAENYFQTSGIIISKEGLILTVNHLLDTGLDKETDPARKKWFLKNCFAAQTDQNRSPIRYDSPRFKEVEIVFQPSSEEYDYESDNRIDFDLAILKFKEPATYPHTSILESLIDTEEKEVKMLLAGYPGAALTGQREFTTIDFFSDLQKYRGKEESGALAVFYEAGSRVFTAASESYKEFQRKLFESGVDSRLVKGGFSGSPVFVKGYLAGITISSSLPYEEEQDKLLLLSSYSIVELLKKKNLELYSPRN